VNFGPHENRYPKWKTQLYLTKLASKLNAQQVSLGLSGGRGCRQDISESRLIQPILEEMRLGLNLSNTNLVIKL
jgi:Fe-S cluster assembly ATPase SufC